MRAVTFYNLNLASVIRYVFLLFITLGQIELFIELKLTNAIQFILAILILIYCMKKATNFKSNYIYLLPFVIVAFILLLFPVGKNLIADVSRISYFSLFILMPFFFIMSNKCYEFEVGFVLKFYFYIAILVVFDAASYISFNISPFFNNINYITVRFIGPFNDPNFLGLIYGIMFLLSFYNDFSTPKVYKYFFGACLVLSGSVTAIFFTVLTILTLPFTSLKFLFLKPLIVIIFTFTFVPLFIAEQQFFASIFNSIVNLFFDIDENLISVKFNSLLFRFESVNTAIQLISNNPLGFGYRSLLDYLPRDTHNSYIGMAFEYGIVTLFLIVFSLLVITRNKSAQAVSTFVCLFGLLLNIHYMPVYFFTVLVCFNSYLNNIRKR